MRYGITGGIGSGKSFVCAQLMKLGFPIFSCDDAARHIVTSVPAVKRALTTLTGNDLYAPDGTLHKALLANYIKSSPEAAKRVNAIVHPLVREAYEQWVTTLEQGETRPTRHATFMECALLFETGFDLLVDRIVFVQAEEEERLRRVMNRDKTSLQEVKAWMNLQMSDTEKALRADIIIHNHGCTQPDLQALLKEISQTENHNPKRTYQACTQKS